MMPRIEELYAWVVADTGPDDEGVPGFTDHNGWILPMMGADLERAESMRGIAQNLANASGKPLKLIHSTGIEIVEIIEPEGVDAVQGSPTEA